MFARRSSRRIQARLVPAATSLLAVLMLQACGRQALPTGAQLPPVTGAVVREAAGTAEATPVLCVPGYLDLDAYFSPLRKRLRESGRDSAVLHLFPNIGDIRVSAQKLADEVTRLRAGSDAKIDLLAHSEGGLIARYYIRFLGGDQAVRTLVTLATPHRGTYVAYVGPGEAARQMRPGSAFLRELNEGDPSWGDVRYVAIRGGLDEIVLPHASMELEGAENIFVRFVDHATIFTSPTVAGHVRRVLGRSD